MTVMSVITVSKYLGQFVENLTPKMYIAYFFLYIACNW